MSAFTEANRQAFNDLSATYNTKPWQHAVANQVAAALQSRKAWLGARLIDTDDATTLPGSSSSSSSTTVNDEEPPIRLLDYACGTGSITRALGSSVHVIRGIDVSENMVARYNQTARESGLSAAQAHAVVGDLCGEAEADRPELQDEREFHDFDIAVVGLGFHHFEDPGRALRRLAARVKPRTGVVVIVDFLPFGEEEAKRFAHHHHHAEKTKNDSNGDEKAPQQQQHPFPEMQHTIKHNGFTADELRTLYTAAGLVDFAFVSLAEPTVMELKTGTVQRTMFVAKGRRE